MHIIMAGLDHSLASVALREKFSFTKTAVADAVAEFARKPGVRGAVLLSTCNRTELYLSLEGDQNVAPDRLLCTAAGHPYEGYAFVIREDEEAVRHLMEVASGLRSRILGEDQILSQVKTAAEISRQAQACDSALATLFRTAVTCGKQVKTNGHLTGVATSAAHMAVKAAQARLGSLSGKKGLVIGNGEMGRLAAGLLRDAGCTVSVTLRSYHHGETVVPAGCSVISYDDRYQAMSGMDLVISATTSPHHTIYRQDFLNIPNAPRLLIDLAIPRDIEPSTGDLPDVTLLNVDDLGENLGADAEAIQQAQETISEYMERFHQWRVYRESLPALEEVKAALRQRIAAYLDADMDAGQAADVTIDKVVDLLAGGMTDGFTTQALQVCTAKIRSHTR